MKTRVKSTLKILDFDLETVAAGFADPQWVPNKITCAAWSWIGEDKVYGEVCGPLGIYTKPELRAKMLLPLLDAIDEADMLTGHNLLKFDLGVLQADCLRLGLPSLKAKLVQDTMRIVKTRGFKKGQDNIGGLVRTEEPKLSLSWQQWEDAYEEVDWGTVKERAMSDVIMHKQMREKMIENKWLLKPVVWRPN